ncbi:MAG TPA: DUF1592 domain-containing protein [Polyangiaceae bacterium]|nr:DUF1592 domain-containing protein [Polyangiaceae bacterium]
MARIRGLNHALLPALVAGFALAASGCTGTINGEDDGRALPCTGCGASGGSAGTGTNPNAGNGGSGATGEPAGVEGIGWTTRYPRLSHAQWENTVRDLLRLDQLPGLAETFSLDPDDSRFDTFSARVVSANLWLDYQRAAELVATDVAQDPAKLAKITPAGGDATAFVTDLGTRAFRRPITSEEITVFVDLFNQGQTLLQGTDAFTSGAEMVIRAFLQSPHFLYRVESSTTASGDKIPLSGYEIASRLSYGLWNTMPSDALLTAAGAGELGTAEGVGTWSRQMLGDPRAGDTLVSFHNQLFSIAEYGTISKNETLFPDFTLELAPTLRDEASLYFREITVTRNGGIGALLTTPVTFVNESTAQYYGATATGTQMQLVQLDATKRAGILTQLGFLSKYGSQSQSDPILRGVHISLEVLCQDLMPPPNGVPPLPPIGEGQTNRERVEVSTSVAPCNGCHENFINPIGFAFENYDAVGQWRDTDNGQPVNAAATYTLDGTPVTYNNAVELSALLAASPTVHECYTRNWLEYAIGRPAASEEDSVMKTVAGLSATGATMSDVLASITGLETFRARPQEMP